MRNSFKDHKLNYITPAAGIAGCMIVGFGLYESASHYTRSMVYSPRNHFISELGLAGASSMANVFDHSVMAGGIMMMIFAYGLGNYLRESRMARYAAVIGMTATLSFSTIGYYTADNWFAHKIVASVFFAGAMISIGLFSFSIWKSRQSRLHPFISVQGLFIVVMYFVVLFWPKELMREYINHPQDFVRPAVWALTVMEWSYCLMICIWIVSVSGNLVYILSSEKSRQTSTVAID